MAVAVVRAAVVTTATPSDASSVGSRLVVASAVVMAALVGAAIGFGVAGHGQSAGAGEPNSTEAAVLTAARSEALALTTIRYGTARQDLDRILAGATGPLRTQFEKERAQLPQTLAANKSSETGTVRAAALSSVSGAKATAVVAVDATLTGSDIGSSGVVKHYRMVVSLQRLAGHWLASNVAFAGQPQ